MCRARQYSDQMICGKCALVWDVNDPDPPVCGEETPLASPAYELLARLELSDGEPQTYSEDLPQRMYEKLMKYAGKDMKSGHHLPRFTLRETIALADYIKDHMK